MTRSVYLFLHLAPRLLLLLICSSTSCLGSHYEECRGNYTCGNFTFGYPFGENNRGCGHPEFQVDCMLSYPRVQIGETEYRISEPLFLSNNNDHTMTVVNQQSCNIFGNYSQSWWYDSQLFRLADGYTNLTFWGNCNQTRDNNFVSKALNFSFCGDVWYYSLTTELDSEGESFCSTHLQLPINGSYNKPFDITALQADITALQADGFEVTWKVDPDNDRRCETCLNSNGSCGYDISNQTAFLCYCSDGTYQPDECPRNGCSIGGLALIAIAVLFLWYCAKRRKQTLRPPRSSDSKVEKFLEQYAYEMPTRYSQSQLKKMTNNFAEKLGEGGFGVVYKGKLQNGALVAVKLLDRHRHGETQFMNEVATVGRIHHVNLVRLLGYCFENPTSALVYEYMVNGSLEKVIFAAKEKRPQVIMWEQLYAIALGVARGIAYLHQDCEKRIIHFDIKPHNILLDAEFTPKVSDFGLAKLCGKGDDHISMTAGRGTPGYVAPEVCDRELGPVTDKSDVYSFGMLLLEIVGGRKNFDWKVTNSSQFYFPEWAFKLLETDDLGMRLRGGGAIAAQDEEQARKLTKVGLWCIQYKSIDRPSMSRVVQMLEGNGDDVANPPLPFNSSSAAAPENPLLSST
eukprot:PITA_11101